MTRPKGYVAAEAVCLRVIPFAETSQVVHLATGEHGLVAALAKGACRPGADLLGGLAVGMVGEALLAPRRGAELEVLRRFRPLPFSRLLGRDLARFHAASYVLDLLRAWMRPALPAPDLHRAAVRTLEALSRARASGIAAWVVWFESRAIASAGEGPRLEACAACGRTGGRATVFAPAAGGLVHATCPTAGPRLPLSPGGVAALRRLYDPAPPRPPGSPSARRSSGRSGRSTTSSSPGSSSAARRPWTPSPGVGTRPEATGWGREPTVWWRAMARRTPAVLLLLALALAACAGSNRSTTSDLPFTGSGGTPLVIPSAPAGDAAARGVADPLSRPAAPPMSQAQATEVARRRLEQAGRLWDQAESIEPTNPDGAGELFQDVVDDYPEYEKAAEAQFRAGRAWYRAAEYDDAAEALEKYMRIAPVNPHLAEVEETLYQSGTRYIREPHGFLGLFGTDEAGLEALQFVAENFRAGRYADDALFALGDYYREDAEFDTAALRYKELLIRYPGSDLALATRLRLGDTYFSRDQGDPYLAGFVDTDPREQMSEEEAKQTGPVRSALALALEQYEAGIAWIEADPARRAAHAAEEACARRKREDCRERLAAKDLYRGDWYSGRGNRSGAVGFWQAAAEWTGTRSGQLASQRLASAAAAGVSGTPGDGRGRRASAGRGSGAAWLRPVPPHGARRPPAPPAFGPPAVPVPSGTVAPPPPVPAPPPRSPPPPTFPSPPAPPHPHLRAGPPYPDPRSRGRRRRRGPLPPRPRRRARFPLPASSSASPSASGDLRPMIRPTRALLLLGLALAPVAACGYSTARLDRVGGARTIAVLPFKNLTFRRDLELRLTEAVLAEIRARTSYALSLPGAADVLLTGTLEATEAVAIETSERTAVEKQFRGRVQVTVTDRASGRVLRSYPVEASPEYTPDRFGESLEGSATNELVRRLAIRIVQGLEAGF